MDLATIEPTNEFNYSVKIKMHKQAIFRSATEIWKEFCGHRRGCMRLLPNGIQIIETNNAKNITCCFELYAENLLIYSYDIRNSSGELLSYYPVSIDSKALFGSIRPDSKNESLYLRMYVSKCLMKNSGIFIAKSETDGAGIRASSDVITDPIALNTQFDYYSNHYKNVVPSAKIPMDTFKTTIARCKGVACSIIEISLNSKGIVTLKGYLQSDISSGEAVPEIVKPFDDSFDYDDPLNDERKFIPTSTIIQMKDNESWLSKMNKLNADSVIHIYMSEKYPMVIKTDLGNYGIAFFTFAGINPSKSDIY